MMRTSISSRRLAFSPTSFGPAVAAIFAILIPTISTAQIFVTNNNTGTIGEFTLSGSPINTTLVTAQNNPAGIIVSGSNLFFSNISGDVPGDGTVSQYTTSGSPIAAPLITGLGTPTAIAISGSDLFVANYYIGTISEYTTSGTLLNSSFISGLNDPGGIAISGSDLFVANYANGVASAGTVSEFTLTGSPVATSLIKNLTGITGLAIDGSNLFLTSNGANNNVNLPIGSVAEYTTAGSPIDTSLITGLTDPNAVTSSIPISISTKIIPVSSPNTPNPAPPSTPPSSQASAAHGTSPSSPSRRPPCCSFLPSPRSFCAGQIAIVAHPGDDRCSISPFLCALSASLPVLCR